MYDPDYTLDYLVLKDWENESPQAQEDFKAALRRMLELYVEKGGCDELTPMIAELCTPRLSEGKGRV